MNFRLIAPNLKRLQMKTNLALFLYLAVCMMPWIPFEACHWVPALYIYIQNTLWGLLLTQKRYFYIYLIIEYWAWKTDTYTYTYNRYVKKKTDKNADSCSRMFIWQIS